MAHYSILDDFFYKTLENYINNNLVFYDYNFPKDQIAKYINELLETNIEEYIKWIDNNFCLVEISSNDMVQYSSFYDVLNLHNVLISFGDDGVNYYEAGKLLLNDGKERKKLAYQKYGENHLKTSEYLGYVFSIDHIFYCSCLGYISEFLNNKQKEMLLVRLIIRTNLFIMIYNFQKNGEVKLRNLFDFLSDSTYKRRLSNVKKILNILQKSDEYDFSKITNKIIY